MTQGKCKEFWLAVGAYKTTLSDMGSPVDGWVWLEMPLQAPIEVQSGRSDWLDPETMPFEWLEAIYSHLSNTPKKARKGLLNKICALVGVEMEEK